MAFYFFNPSEEGGLLLLLLSLAACCFNSVMVSVNSPTKTSCFSNCSWSFFSLEAAPSDRSKVADSEANVEVPSEIVAAVLPFSKRTYSSFNSVI